MACSSPDRIADTSIASGETTLEAAGDKPVISSFLGTSRVDQQIAFPDLQMVIVRPRLISLSDPRPKSFVHGTATNTSDSRSEKHSKILKI
jgi:hypothetical protein